MDGMKQAKIRLPVNPNLIWEAAIDAFMKSTPRDKEPLIQAMRTIR